MSEFEKYARNHCGISSLKLHDFQSVSAAYVSPTIIEERQLNIACAVNKMVARGLNMTHPENEAEVKS